MASEADGNLDPTTGDRFQCMAKLLALVAVFAAVSLVVNAVGGEDVAADSSSSASDSSADADSADAGVGTPDQSLDTVEGQFLVSGSSTVFPIVQRQAEQFESLAPGIAIAVEGPGSGDGAKKFCAGEVPIANASRSFKDEEIAICEEAGIEFIEIRRAIDGISVITSPENDAIACLSFNDLYALLSEEATQTDTWSAANELTGTWGGQEFADIPLDVFGPGEESGTFDSFAEIVIESVVKGKTGLDPESREFSEGIRPDYTSSPDDNVVMEGIEASQYSLGWVGYAYAQESEAAGRAKLLAVSVEDGGNCVIPTAESIASADFPIARFLYTYINADAAQNQPGVADFVDYMMSDVGLESVSAVGYIDLPAEGQAKAQSIWADRLTGRQYE